MTTNCFKLEIVSAIFTALAMSSRLMFSMNCSLLTFGVLINSSMALTVLSENLATLRS